MSFATSLEKHGLAPALRLPGRAPVSYAQLAADCDAFAASLPKGKQLLMIETRNDYPSILAYLAGLRRGDTVTLIDAGLKEELKAALINSYRPDIVWREMHLESPSLKKEKKLQVESPPLKRVKKKLQVESPPLKKGAGGISSNSQRSGKSKIPLTPFDKGGTLIPIDQKSFSNSITKYELIRTPDPARDPLFDDLALLLSTSGSTGSPKCVRLTLDNLHSNAVSIAEYLEIGNTEIAVTLLPLHYSFGLSILNSHLAVGASIVVQEEGIIDREFWQTVKAEKVTSLSGVPFIYETLSKLRFERMQLPHMRYLTQAGGRLAPDLVEKFATLCRDKGWRFYVMYGQTEATARISYLPPEKALKKPSSIGSAIPGGTLTIHDDKGQVITEPDRAGELIYRGPNVMLGYAQGREDLKQGDELNGMLETGDIARCDVERDLYIVGRKKRFIKLFGQRFGLDEIESHLRSEGTIAACGGKDDTLEVVLQGRHNEEAVQKSLANRYRVHVSGIWVRCVDELPKNANGKIDYVELFSDKINNR